MKTDSVIIKVENGKIVLYLSNGMDGRQLTSWLETNRIELKRIKQMMSP